MSDKPWEDYAPAPAASAPGDAPWLAYGKGKVQAPAAPATDDRNFVSKIGTGLHQAGMLASKGLTDTAKFFAGDYLSKPFQVLNEYATSKGYPLTPTEGQIQQGTADVKKAGGWAQAGQFGGQVALEALTAPLMEAKMAASGAKVLPEALQYLAKPAAQVGANAATSAAFAPEDKAGAAEGGAQGTVYGSALAKTLVKGYEYAKKGAGRIYEELAPEAGAQARALRAIERTAGKDEVARVADLAAQPPTPSSGMLPQTTAAKANSAPLGAMEGGARLRNPARAEAIDKSVDEASWGILKGATPNADQAANLRGEHTKVFNAGQELLDKLPFSKANRAEVSKKLLDLRNSNIVSGDTTKQSAGAINIVLEAIDNPNTSLGVLAHMHSTLDGSNPGIARVKTILKDVLDTRSKGQFTNILEGYKATSEAAEAAERAAALRGKFMGPDNVPKTTRAWGESGQPTALPGLDAAPLRREISKNDPANAQLNALADALRGKEIHKTPGSRSVDPGKAESVATAGLNAGPLWRLRGTIGAAFGPINEKTTKAIDEALFEPQKFLDLMDARRAKQIALQPWEAKLEKIIRSGGQVGARIGSQAGQGE